MTVCNLDFNCYPRVKTFLIRASPNELTISLCERAVSEPIVLAFCIIMNNRKCFEPIISQFAEKPLLRSILVASLNKINIFTQL